MERIQFSPYKCPELIEIVNSRLESAKIGFQGEFPQIFKPDTISFAAMKVSSISGDARRVLDVCRFGKTAFASLVEAHRKNSIGEQSNSLCRRRNPSPLMR